MLFRLKEADRRWEIPGPLDRRARANGAFERIELGLAQLNRVVTFLLPSASAIAVGTGGIFRAESEDTGSFEWFEEDPISGVRTPLGEGKAAASFSDDRSVAFVDPIAGGVRVVHVVVVLTTDDGKKCEDTVTIFQK